MWEVMGVNKNKVRVALKSVVKTTRQGTCWPADFFFSVFFSPRVKSNQPESKPVSRAGACFITSSRWDLVFAKREECALWRRYLRKSWRGLVPIRSFVLAKPLATAKSTRSVDSCRWQVFEASRGYNQSRLVVVITIHVHVADTRLSVHVSLVLI